MSVFPNLLASIPVTTLKSAFSREILLLSPGLMELGFFGLAPKTIILVLILLVGVPPLWMAWTTSVSGVPIVSQHSEHKRDGMPSVPGAASKLESDTTSFTFLAVGRASSFLLSNSVNTLSWTSAYRVFLAARSTGWGWSSSSSTCFSR